MIRAFATLANQDPEPHLLLVGDGPELDPLQRLANDLGVLDRVRFAGYQALPQHFLHLMDIFALTSRLEGMPLAILEAWAAGCPVIASRVGGVPRLVQDDQTGVLFDSGDQAALSTAITNLLTSPSKARRLGDAGRECARSRYDLRVMAENYERHYRELLCAHALGNGTRGRAILR